MKVLVCGDRNWGSALDRQLLTQVLDILHKHRHFTLLIHGDARGADRMGRDWARARGIKVKPFPADWVKYGYAAGPIRNQEMLDKGRPELVIAFHRNIRESKGTKDMLERAWKAEIDWLIYPSQNEQFQGL